jgi:trimeric autotransporter adhesin
MKRLLLAMALAAYCGQPAAKLSADAVPSAAVMTTCVGYIFPMDGARADAQSIGSPTTIALDLIGGTPISITMDTTGGFYFARGYGPVRAIYHVSADGFLLRVDGRKPGLTLPSQSFNVGMLAADHSGNLILVERYRILKVSRDGTISSIAGNGNRGSSGDGGPALTAEIGWVRAIAIDAADNIFFSEETRIRKITKDGLISTVLGPTNRAALNPGSSAIEFRQLSISSLAVDRAGALYAAASGAWGYRIFKISPQGDCAVIAGGVKSQITAIDGPALDAILNSPSNLCVDSDGNLFFLNKDNIVRVTPEGAIAIIAGNGVNPFGIGDAAATAARLFKPRSLAVDALRNLWIADSGNERIWNLAPNGVIQAMAGIDRTACIREGGPATRAHLMPLAIAADKAGTLFVVDEVSHRIFKVNTKGIITTIAGNGKTNFSGDGGPATAAGMNPGAIALDKHGNLYVADLGESSGPGSNTLKDASGNLFYVETGRVRLIQPNGKIRTIVGDGMPGFGGEGGPAINAGPLSPKSLAVDRDGNLYISTGAYIRKVSSKGIITTIAGVKTHGAGGDGGLAKMASVSPSAIAVDAHGNLFVADESNYRISKISPGGIIRTVVGLGKSAFSSDSGDGGAAVNAEIGPGALAVDRAGNLYVADRNHNSVRMITPDGIISTVAGDGTNTLDDNPSAASAPLGSPTGVAVDHSGNLFISSSYGVVRKLARHVRP